MFFGGQMMGVHDSPTIHDSHRPYYYVSVLGRCPDFGTQLTLWASWGKGLGNRIGVGVGIGIGVVFELFNISI